ncbi:hypothetical protein JZ751_018205 [Albula glossodonta]|uniref:Uncharacterized protein n=1 Tax=Albula glossodonta TaxID=121402 RepID=A0A8T2NWP6_9TELE|nr:hypothetical protein JZ751_018205 [Albula glossodonta]
MITRHRENLAVQHKRVISGPAETNQSWRSYQNPTQNDTQARNVLINGPLFKALPSLADKKWELWSPGRDSIGVPVAVTSVLCRVTKATPLSPALLCHGIDSTKPLGSLGTARLCRSIGGEMKLETVAPGICAGVVSASGPSRCEVGEGAAERQHEPKGGGRGVGGQTGRLGTSPRLTGTQLLYTPNTLLLSHLPDQSWNGGGEEGCR